MKWIDCLSAAAAAGYNNMFKRELIFLVLIVGSIWKASTKGKTLSKYLEIKFCSIFNTWRENNNE